MKRRSLLVAVLVALLTAGCTYRSTFIVNASRGDAGQFGDDRSFTPSLSGDGRLVAFSSIATNLVTNDTNDAEDVFVRDLRNDTTSLVSVATDDLGNATSSLPVISANGRYIAFQSHADNLVADDHNDASDVYLRDLQSGTTTRVSVDTTGGDPDGPSDLPSISADGRFVAFRSSASDLVAGAGSAATIFVRDVQLETTAAVDLNTAGGPPNGRSHAPSISADGRYVAFESDADDLVAGDGNAVPGHLGRDIFVRDTELGTTIRASVDTEGGDANHDSGHGVISGDGQFVAFESRATNLVDAPAGFVFVRDLATGTTTAVDIDPQGNAAQPDFSNGEPAISGDGRYVAFVSYGTKLVPGEAPEQSVSQDIFVRDMGTGITSRASLDFIQRAPNGESIWPSLSADGRYIAFATAATNLVPVGTDSVASIAVRALVTPRVTAVTPSSAVPGAVITLTITGDGFRPDAFVTLHGPNGAHVTSVDVVSETEIHAHISIDVDAPAGPRDVRITNPGTGPGPATGGTFNCGNCFEVT